MSREGGESVQQVKRLLRSPLGMLPLRHVQRRWLVLAALVIVAGVVGGVLWARRGAGQGGSTLQAFTVERGSLVATVSSTGEVYAPRQAELSFDVNRISLTELNVAPGQQVKAGDVLARIDPTTLERAVTQAQADLTVAQDGLDKAQNPYTELDLTKAGLSVQQAQVDLADAQEKLEALLNPDVEAAERAVRDAEVALKSAQSQLVTVQNDSENAAKLRTLEYEATWYENNYAEAQVKFQRGEIDQQKLDWEYSNMLAAQERLRVAQAKAESSLASAENQVEKAQEAYQEAQDALAVMRAGGDQAELAKAKLQAAQAQYNLDKAQVDLAAIEAGPAPKDVEAAQAKVVSAQATLEEAQALLEAATMTAPFDGTVISVGAAVGDLVPSGNVVVTLADLSNLRVTAVVDETDIANVQIGQQVTITFDALAGSRFQGQVLEVPLQGKLTQNILTYEVPVSLEGATASLKPGMTANLSIVVGRPENVLLVPALAVQQSDQGSVVLLQDSPKGPVVEAPVQLGLSDGMYVEVKRGLNEGDRVVFEYQEAQETQFGGRAFGGDFGSMMQGGGRTLGR
jgi:HlyD family secretion protein